MRITGSSIVGYSLGIPALLVGTLTLLVSPFLTTSVFWAALFGLAGVLAGLVLTPWTRRGLANRAGLEFSRGGVAAIVAVALLVGFVSAFGVLATAGDGSEDTGPAVSPVTIDASPETVTESTNYSLDVEYNHATQQAVDPDTSDFQSYSAQDGEKFVVVQLRVTNTGSEAIDLNRDLFRLRSAGVVIDPQSFFGASGRLDVTLDPDGTATGWIVYSVDESVERAELTTDSENAYYDQPVDVTVSHNDSLPIAVSG